MSDEKIGFRQPPSRLVFSNYDNGVEYFRFEADGRCFVRGELVESNVEIFEEFKHWLAGLRSNRCKECGSLIDVTDPNAKGGHS